MPPSTSLTPAAAGFHMPAEWAPHARSWMAWPCRTDLWNGREAEAKAAFAAVARAIAGFEPISMLARPEDVEAARSACGSSVEIVPMPLDDSWVRDSGPTFLVDASGHVAGAAWRFNAWGGKFPPYDQDAKLAGRILATQGMAAFEAPFVLEGGSIHTDGDGTLVTTEQCLLNPNRNPHLTKPEIERALMEWLGVRKVIWLGEGLENDHTDGHVDDITCFARPGAVITATCDDPADANYRPLTDNIERLRKARDAQGRTLEIIGLPLPARRMTDAGRLVLTYVNFYLTNGGVVVPSFDDPLDAEAAEILSRAFPGRRVVQVPALDILEGGGGIHCITQQQPAGPAALVPEAK
ncbi:MAG TPA: agmatine deiminase family protein [Aliidongia sp.]|nr:agmatine deiminase family protein [Aliidongia sp.]